mmetsp:Transcript_66606/g.192356  ORF Transcript_66606/g.192356 Transcript_66606/m.192356 type:complete len:265 (-) Transcript_66606:1635-2429(-)
MSTRLPWRGSSRTTWRSCSSASSEGSGRSTTTPPPPRRRRVGSRATWSAHAWRSAPRSRRWMPRGSSSVRSARRRSRRSCGRPRRTRGCSRRPRRKSGMLLPSSLAVSFRRRPRRGLCFRSRPCRRRGATSPTRPCRCRRRCRTCPTSRAAPRRTCAAKSLSNASARPRSRSRKRPSVLPAWLSGVRCPRRAPLRRPRPGRGRSASVPTTPRRWARQHLRFPGSAARPPAACSRRPGDGPWSVARRSRASRAARWWGGARICPP